ncbi:MAG: heavy metal-binding domain-containing protein, partial [Candidatus Acidiferrales bacterium]
MAVEPEGAKATVEHAGKTYYFCCTACATKFEADPRKYLNGASDTAISLIQLVGEPVESARSVQLGGNWPASKPAQTQPKGEAYICPMDPDVRQEQPGACPKCGMALEPQIPAAPATRVEYTCPMHSQIVRPGPGSCPICGMALEPRTVTVGDEANPELADMTRRFWISVALAL